MYDNAGAQVIMGYLLVNAMTPTAVDLHLEKARANRIANWGRSGLCRRDAAYE
jgi:hypothetical protein